MWTETDQTMAMVVSLSGANMQRWRRKARGEVVSNPQEAPREYEQSKRKQDCEEGGEGPNGKTKKARQGAMEKTIELSSMVEAAWQPHQSQ
jgi:hypothetical protein